MNLTKKGILVRGTGGLLVYLATTWKLERGLDLNSARVLLQLLLVSNITDTARIQQEFSVR